MHEHKFWKHFQQHAQGFDRPDGGPYERAGFGFGRERAEFGGRDDRRGGRGGGGRRGGWFGFGMGGGPGGFDFRTGRKLSSGELQLVLLALIGDKPRHGYDLIKAIDEASGGFYVPSPGVIYPALTYLEEAGDIAAEAEGSRKLYSLTEQGKEHLAKRRQEADEILAQLKAIAERMGRVREAFTDEGEESDLPRDFPRGPWSVHVEMGTAIAELFGMLKRSKHLSPKATEQIVAIIKRAAQAIAAVVDEDRR